MSAEVIGIIGLVILIVLLFARMWIGAAMATVGFFGYAAILGFKPAFGVIAQIPFTTVADYPLITVPLFTFMGLLIFNAGIGEDLYYAAYKCVGQLRGGLAMATVIACTFFASITGVSGPAIITMGKVAVPEMRRYNYADTLATGSIACAGTLAFLIPPSVAFIIYGILTENPIGKLFIAGFLPGLLLSALFIMTIVIITTLNPKAGPAGPKTTFKEKIISLKGAWPTVLLFLLVLGGIYGGVFTPTEAGALGAFGAIVITTASRRLTWQKFRDSLLDSGQTTAMIFLLIIGAFILMKFLAVTKLPFLLADTIAGLPVPTMVIFAAIVLLYLILGMFLDIVSAVILTIPVIYPLVLTLGFDPIWFGVVVVIVIEMGLVTPPVGMDVFILAGAIDTPLFTIFRGVVPFVIAMIIGIILIASFPQIALFLPNTM
jgi:tripartite ATP-independent transporter DctM subunit